MSHEAIRQHCADLANLITDRDILQAVTEGQRATILDQQTQIAALQAQIDAAKDPLSGWKLIFEDTFSTNVPLGQFPAAVASKWRAYPSTYSDTSKNGVYDAVKTVSISNGTMKIHMFTDGNGIVRVAAPVPVIRTPLAGELWPGQLYGRYETVARFPTVGAGFKVAWLLWPDKGTNTTGSPSGTGGNGEIDFPEHGLGQQTVTSGFMHRQDATVGADQYAVSAQVDLKVFHSFVTEWSKDLCRFLIDGKEIGRTTDRVPLTSMHWVLQCETQLSGGKPAASAVADIEIDAVRVWSKV